MTNPFLRYAVEISRLGSRSSRSLALAIPETSLVLYPLYSRANNPFLRYAVEIPFEISLPSLSLAPGHRSFSTPSTRARVIFTDKFALSQSDARISVAYNSCR